MEKSKQMNEILEFVNVDPLENPKLWPKSTRHDTKRFIFIAPSSNSQFEHIKAFRQPPGALLSLVAIVQEIRPDIECVIVDEALGDIFPSNIKPENDIIGITANTAERNYAYALAVKLRMKYPEVPIICGGPHVTFNEAEALHFFDVVFRGEAEDILDRFFKDLKNGNLSSVYNGCDNPVDLSRPDFPLLEPKKFLQQPEEYGSYFLLTSRGCNNRCIFCAEQAFSGHGIRYLDIERVERQIDNLPKRPILYVADDNLLADRERAIKVGQMLKERNIAWFCHANINIGEDTELLEILGKSGCFMLVSGIESIQPNVLRSLGKAHVNKPENYETMLNNIRNIGGMGVYGEFILWSTGFEFPDSVKRLADWIQAQKAIECIQLTIETPLPGTKLREIRKKQDRILKIGPFGKKVTWTDYDLIHITQKIPGISPEQAQRALHWLYRELYGTTSLFTWKYIPGFIATHFFHSHGTIFNRLIGTIFSYKFHTGVNSALKMHEMETPQGKLNITSL